MSALVMPVSDVPDVAGTMPEVFRADDGRSATTNIPQVKAALVALYEAWPRALSFEALQARVAAQLGGGLDGHAEVVATGMLQCYLSNMVAFHVEPAQFALQAGPLPRASTLVRQQAARGWPIANRRHRVVPLGDADRLLLSLLDGQTDRPALAAALARAVASGSLPPADLPAGPWDDPAGWLAGPLESSLDLLARNALLLG
jgi:methyltransferase-like protein